MYIVSNPYNDYGTIYGITETLDNAIKLSYDAYVYDSNYISGDPVSVMSFSKWHSKKHWEDWVSEWEVGKSWLYESEE